MDDVTAEANQARRLREARARRTRRLALRWLAIAAAVFVGYYLLDTVAGPFGSTGFGLAMATMLILCALSSVGRRSPPADPAVAPGDLPALPERTEAGMAAQRPSLPAPAVTLLDGIGARVAALGPQLARLDEGSEPADALRRLVGVELPGLVGQYRAVPAGLRGEARDDGESPDARLIHGLGVVDRHLADLTRRLGSGAADSLSTHDRYLQSKYGADGDGNDLGLR